MAAWLVERRLSQVAVRLKSLRDELAMIDEQLDHLATDADDQAIRALVSETPGAAFDANDARKHADAMSRHRDHIVVDDRRARATPGRAARQAHGEQLTPRVDGEGAVTPF